MTFSPSLLAFDLCQSELVPAWEPLAARQLDCLRCAAAGKRSGDIGAVTRLSSRPVDHHLAAARRRLGVPRVQAVVVALQRQLITTSRA